MMKLAVIGSLTVSGILLVAPCSAQESAPSAGARVELVRTNDGKLVSPFASRRACANDKCGELIYNTKTKDVVSFLGQLTPRYQLGKDGLSIVRAPVEPTRQLRSIPRKN